MKKIKILNKKFSKPISCLTAYSPSIANILDGKIDLILVGDSIGSTLYGMNNTQGVTMDMMKNHGATVNKEIKKSLKVLVFDDLINLSTNDKKLRFVKNYFNFNKVAGNVVKKYNREVKLKKFPSTKFTYN